MGYNFPEWAKDYSDSNLDDIKLAELFPLLNTQNIRWLDLRFNHITKLGLESLCAQNLPALEVVELFGNPCGCPTETYNTDVATGDILRNTIRPTSLVVELEKKFGYRKWFHPISEFSEPFPLPSDLLRLDPLFDPSDDTMEDLDFEED